jgi:hypothetical protein
MLSIADRSVRNFSVRSCSTEQLSCFEGKQAQMMSGALTNSSQNRARIAFEYRTARQAGRIPILSAIPVRFSSMVRT